MVENNMNYEDNRFSSSNTLSPKIEKLVRILYTISIKKFESDSKASEVSLRVKSDNLIKRGVTQDTTILYYMNTKSKLPIILAEVGFDLTEKISYIFKKTSFFWIRIFFS